MDGRPSGWSRAKCIGRRHTPRMRISMTVNHFSGIRLPSLLKTILLTTFYIKFCATSFNDVARHSMRPGPRVWLPNGIMESFASSSIFHACNFYTTNSKTIAPSICFEGSETVREQSVDANERNLSRIQSCKKLRTPVHSGKIPLQTVRSSEINRRCNCFGICSISDFSDSLLIRTRLIDLAWDFWS
jgi:hypothetical protein